MKRHLTAIGFILLAWFSAASAAVTETFDGAGFSNHQDLGTSVELSGFVYEVQTGGSLKAVTTGGAALFPGYDPGKPANRFTIRHATGAEFDFRRISATDEFRLVNPVVTVAGYRNGVQVTAAMQITLAYPESSFDFSAQAGFSNVDEVRFSADDIYFFLESWTWDAPQPVSGTVAMPVFSLSGAHHETTSTLTLSTPTTAAQIRYTLDGTEPTESASLYSGPLSFGMGAVTVKARAFKAGWTASAVASATYTFFAPLALEDANGLPLGDIILHAGDALTFTIAGGSSHFDIVTSSNATGVSGTLIDNGNGGYSFFIPTTGAFAGDYRITLTDKATGWSRQVTVSVPLQAALSRSALLALGERNHAEVTVTGAAPATAITLKVTSSALGALPTVDDTGMVATDDGPNGNPASGSLTAQPTDQGITFAVVAAAAGYPDGRVAAQVLPAVSYAGRLTNPVGSALQGKAELRTSVNGFATTLKDELNDLYETNTDALGHFTLIGPADGLDYLLRLSAAGHAAKSVAAPECLAFSPCLVVLDYEFTTATPELNPPGGAFGDMVEITLTTTTADAILVYTLDGTLPSRNNGTAVASSTVLVLRSNKTLKVMAWKEGLNNSEVISAEYTIKDTGQLDQQALLDMGNANTTKKSGGGTMGWQMLLALGGMLLGWRRRSGARVETLRLR
jgi:hypothetical protein